MLTDAPARTLKQNSRAIRSNLTSFVAVLRQQWSNKNEKIRINNHCPRGYRLRRVIGGDGVMKTIRKKANRIGAEAILITETPSGALIDFYRFDEDDGAEVYVAGEWRFNGNTLGGLQNLDGFHFIDSQIPWYYVAAFWAMIGWAVCRMVVAL